MIDDGLFGFQSLGFQLRWGCDELGTGVASFGWAGWVRGVLSGVFLGYISQLVLEVVDFMLGFLCGLVVSHYPFTLTAYDQGYGSSSSPVVGLVEFWAAVKPAPSAACPKDGVVRCDKGDGISDSSSESLIMRAMGSAGGMSACWSKLSINSV